MYRLVKRLTAAVRFVAWLPNALVAAVFLLLVMKPEYRIEFYEEISPYMDADEEASEPLHPIHQQNFEGEAP